MKQDERHQPINGTAWTNVDIVGSVTDKSAFSLRDDFHAAVNRDWLAQAQIRPGNSSESAFWERMREVQSQIEELLRDTSLTGHEADLVHALYAACLDMDARNERGVEPVRPLFDRIRAISSLSELTAYLCGDAFLTSSCLIDSEPFADKKDSRQNVVYVDHAGLTLQDANEYRDMTAQGERMKAANHRLVADMLVRLGLVRDEAEQVNAAAFELESAIAQHCLGNDARARDDFEELTYNPRDLAGLAAEAGAFPIQGVLDALGFSGSTRFVLGEPEWLAALGDLYAERNLEGFKALLLTKLVMRFSGSLDQEAYDLVERWKREWTGSTGSKPLERHAYDTCNNLLGMAVGRMYTDRFLAPQTKADVEALIAEVIATYRKRLQAADWLSPATRDRACEKLDALTARVGRPTRWPEYERLSFDPGDSLVDMRIKIDRFENSRDRDKVNEPVDREEWLMNPQAVNAYYLPTDNSINILAGILGGVFYDPQGTREQLMGGIGMVIGHEITHAFDKNGSLYDKDGNLGNSWWTDEDRAEFKKRTDAVAAWWNNIEVLPGLNVDGDLCVTEVVADLGGMACMCAIGHDHEGFDFARMFEAFARDWRLQEAPEYAEFLLTNDVHAPAHLRTNGTVAMLPEFHEAFGVQPGDGMWLAPEDRFEIW